MSLITRSTDLIPNEPEFKHGDHIVQCHAHSRVCAVCGQRPQYTNPDTGEVTEGCVCPEGTPKARCLQPARQGMKVCYYHGGGGELGPSSGRPTSRYDNENPTIGGLLRDYHAAYDDPLLFSVRAETALLVARSKELVELKASYGIPSTSQAWKQIKDGLKAIENGAVESGLELIYEAINFIDHDREIFDELRTNMAEQRKLADTERKRESELSQFISAMRLMSILAEIVDRFNRIIDEHVTEDRLRNTLISTFAAEIRGIISQSFSRSSGVSE